MNSNTRLAMIALLVLLTWQVSSLCAGAELIPSPWTTAKDLAQLLCQSQAWQHIILTFVRLILGLAAAGALALVLGTICGRSKAFMEVLSPLIFDVQGCPTIVWVSLLMIWVGIGSVVPVAALVVAAFPALFFNIAHGVAAVDSRLLEMARLYRVPLPVLVRRLLLPGIVPHLTAGFSFALSISWKVVSTAEFIASDSGIGSQIYWAYRLLNVPRLFSWALLLMLMGAVIELGVIAPLRNPREASK